MDLVLVLKTQMASMLLKRRMLEIMKVVTCGFPTHQYLQPDYWMPLPKTPANDTGEDTPAACYTGAMVADEIIANAQRLLDDGRLLLGAGAHRTATALFVLSMEESGKACLLKWIERGYAKSEILSELKSGHIEKQYVYLTYLHLKAIMKVGDFGVKTPAGRHELLVERPEELDAQLAAELEKNVSFPGSLIPVGLYDHMKQSGLYTDVKEDGTVARVSYAHRPLARLLEGQAAEAIGMASLDDRTHDVFADLYFSKEIIKRIPGKQRREELNSLIERFHALGKASSR